MDAAEGAGDHKSILPIRYPARKPSPTIAARTNAANAKTVNLSPTFAIVSFILGQIGQEVKGAGDEDAAFRAPSARARAPPRGLSTASTCPKYGLRALGQLLGGEGAVVAGRRGDERGRRGRRTRRACRRRPCRRGSRPRRRSGAWGRRASSVADAGRGCAPRPRSRSGRRPAARAAPEDATSDVRPPRAGRGTPRRPRARGRGCSAPRGPPGRLRSHATCPPTPALRGSQ